MSPKDLKQVGLKVTLPRMKILNMLKNREHQHMSAEDIYKSLLSSGEEIGLATVYRVLTQFESAGLVKRHHFEGGQSVFEIDQGAHHDHMVCLTCGRIEEFCDELIEHQQRQIASRMGYALVRHSLVLYGDCSKENCPNRALVE